MTHPIVKAKIQKIIDRLEEISIDETNGLDQDQLNFLDEAIEALRNLLEEV